MPIPLLIVAAAAGATALGVGKAIKAGADQKDANETDEKANEIVEAAKYKIEKNRKNCSMALNNLGVCKIRILDESIQPFIEEFKKLNHVELSESKGLNEFQKIVMDKKEFTELKELQSMASSMVGGMSTGAMAGALTAFGAYGAANALAVASTETAISAMSEMAATNSTLVFLGGGPLGADGLEIASGTAVFGGLVSGPALAILGFVGGAKASANKEKAYSNLAKAKEFREEMDAATSLCIGIRRRSNMFNRFLLTLNSVFEPLIYEMRAIIKKRGKDFRKFNDEEKNTVAEAMALAGAIKAILDTSILDDDGNLAVESEAIVDETRKRLDDIL